MIDILHYILDVLWTMVKIDMATCLILFFISVGVRLVDEIVGRKNG